MCGISGSNEFERAFNLYKLNLARGSHSSGFMSVCLQTGDFFIDKVPQIFDEHWFNDKYKKYLNKNFYFLFHSRAPTNSINSIWTTENTHPFEWKGYYVAHNGIISNFKNLEDNECFEVDSSIIPYLLFKNNGNVSETYSNLQGLLTSWIFNSKLNKIYLAKAGSTLWIDQHSFSSTFFDNSVAAKDGDINVYSSKEGFVLETEKINYKSSYFIL
jgi:predicted glutamine amidotransferase